MTSLTTTQRQIVESDLGQCITHEKLLGEGWSNTVSCINNKWVARFPHTPESTQVAVEKQFLYAFGKGSPINLPNLKQTEGNYCLYPLLDGKRLNLEEAAKLSHQEKQKACHQLGEFLSWLHTSSFTDENLSTAPYGEADFYQDLWQYVAEALPCDLRLKAEAYLDSYFTTVPDEERKPVICHGDLGLNNILWDNSNAISSIIDFTDLFLCDPAYDFNAFYSYFGQKWVNMMSETYTPHIGDHFWQRVTFNKLRKALFVVYYARHFGYESYIPGRIESIKESLSQQLI
ncbi:hypothetical protein CS022_12825 [Veronia nyctiphanis]|uniref:Aminoglycoside phosphotransferase domain-containing protein n=1 Tax=Veronia nyctiphanis TaxID=1278244 RepID=A0A4Q0YPP5_9GAMM|nr:aminoglycoside phosphotransferase family protein [Veronia nyctiphanis]RXJ72952.1 hypothetical protein CS022_12825 [Veronia nyctiphanis]